MMNINDINERKSIFWILQISGWISLGFIYLLLYSREYIDDPKAMIALSLTYITGFLSSLVLHYFYKKVHYQNLSMIKLT